MSNPRPKILSIDDNQMLNLIRQKVLSTSGFECDLAYTAEQSLGMVMTGHYDVILLDYYLPGTTGLQVASTIKTLRPEVPIILVTGEEMHECSEFVHSYLIKGEGPEALIARLKSVVNVKGSNNKAMRARAG
jgi:DNA-binding response OmpR family regulator